VSLKFVVFITSPVNDTLSRALALPRQKCFLELLCLNYKYNIKCFCIEQCNKSYTIKFLSIIQFGPINYSLENCFYWQQFDSTRRNHQSAAPAVHMGSSRSSYTFKNYITISKISCQRYRQTDRQTDR
jgi:hypothetical protein